jgi:hypothetical protein
MEDRKEEGRRTKEDEEAEGRGMIIGYGPMAVGCNRFLYRARYQILVLLMPAFQVQEGRQTPEGICECPGGE